MERGAKVTKWETPGIERWSLQNTKKDVEKQNNFFSKLKGKRYLGKQKST